MTTLKILSLAVIISTCLTSCHNESKKKVEDADEKMEQAGHDLKQAVQNELMNDADDWQEFKKKAEQKISDNQKQIDAIKSRLAASGDKLKTEYQQKVNDLEKKNADLKKQLEDYKDQGDGAWQKFKTDIDSQMKQLKTAIDDSTHHDF